MQFLCKRLVKVVNQPIPDSGQNLGFSNDTLVIERHFYRVQIIYILQIAKRVALEASHLPH